MTAATMSWRRILGLRTDGERTSISRLAFGCTVVAAALTWLLTDRLEWHAAFSVLATLAVITIGLLVAARRRAPRSALAFVGLGAARRTWSPGWQVAVCAAFVGLAVVAVNVDLPAWQRVLGWAVACLALGLTVGVVSRRRVP